MNAFNDPGVPGSPLAAVPPRLHAAAGASQCARPEPPDRPGLRQRGECASSELEGGERDSCPRPPADSGQANETLADGAGALDGPSASDDASGEAGLGPDTDGWLPELEVDLSNPAIRVVAEPMKWAGLRNAYLEYLCLERKFGHGSVHPAHAFVCFIRELAHGTLIDLGRSTEDPNLAAMALDCSMRLNDRLDEQIERQNRDCRRRAGGGRGRFESPAAQRRHLVRAQRWYRIARRSRSPEQCYLRLAREFPDVVRRFRTPAAGCGRRALSVRGMALGMWRLLHAGAPKERLRAARELFGRLLATKHWKFTDPPRERETLEKEPGARPASPTPGTGTWLASPLAPSAYANAPPLA